MMETPLNAWLLFDHSPRHAPEAELVSRTPSGDVERSTYAEFGRRTQQLMHALDHLGLEPGDRVATLAWNSARHLEAYFAVPCTGRVLHTLNVRVSPEELAFMLEDADDRAVLVDPDLLPLLEQALALGPSPRARHRPRRPRCPTRRCPASSPTRSSSPASRPTTRAARSTNARRWGSATRRGPPGGPRASSTPIARPSSTPWPSPPMPACRSGRAMRCCRRCRCSTPTPGACRTRPPRSGRSRSSSPVPSKPSAFVDLLVTERVTVSAGVPTVWLGIADELARRGETSARPPPHHLRRIAAASCLHRALSHRVRYPIVQAWGMTETSPLASVAWPQEHMRDWGEEEITDGRPDPGRPAAPRGGDQHPGRGGRPRSPPTATSMGDLLRARPVGGRRLPPRAGRRELHGRRLVQDRGRGGALGRRLLRDRRPHQGPHQVGRRVDLLGRHGGSGDADRQGGRGRGHRRPRPQVAGTTAGLRGAQAGAELTVEEVRDHLLAAGFARWQLPERIEVIDAVPRTSVGKFDKKALRARFG